ncbi:MAG: hypothetical protein HOG49_09445, partial [Candidatus Scalindua sp.]|nr:hypothetical protein [Candidatus Scalindua sp.]
FAIKECIQDQSELTEEEKTLFMKRTKLDSLEPNFSLGSINKDDLVMLDLDHRAIERMAPLKRGATVIKSMLEARKKDITPKIIVEVALEAGFTAPKSKTLFDSGYSSVSGTSEIVENPEFKKKLFEYIEKNVSYLSVQAEDKRMVPSSLVVHGNTEAIDKVVRLNNHELMDMYPILLDGFKVNIPSVIRDSNASVSKLIQDPNQLLNSLIKGSSKEVTYSVLAEKLNIKEQYADVQNLLAMGEDTYVEERKKEVEADGTRQKSDKMLITEYKDRINKAVVLYGIDKLIRMKALSDFTSNGASSLFIHLEKTIKTMLNKGSDIAAEKSIQLKTLSNKLKIKSITQEEYDIDKKAIESKFQKLIIEAQSKVSVFASNVYPSIVKTIDADYTAFMELESKVKINVNEKNMNKTFNFDNNYDIISSTLMAQFVQNTDKVLMDVGSPGVGKTYSIKEMIVAHGGLLVMPQGALSIGISGKALESSGVNFSGKDSARSNMLTDMQVAILNGEMFSSSLLALDEYGRLIDEIIGGRSGLSVTSGLTGVEAL